MSAPLHVVFRLAETTYAVPASDVLQMESFQGATAVPGASPWIAGLVQVRGRVIPVIDLRARLGAGPAAATLDSRIVVVQRGTRTFGLLVDLAREIRPVPETSIAPAPDGLRAATGGFVRAVARDDQRLLMMIDLDAILGADGHG